MDIRRFNRDTAWLATGVLGTVVLAALMLAVEERQPKATQAERDLLPNANSATVESVVAKSSNSNGKMTPGPGSSVDPTFTETSLQEIPSSQMEPAASTPISAPAFTPQKNRDAPRQDSTQAPAPKTRNVRNRSSVASRSIDVKRRLIELWHQSLARSETRSWTAFSKLNSGVKKKSRLHRRNKGLGKPRFRLFPHRQYMRKPIIPNDCIFLSVQRVCLSQVCENKAARRSL